MPLSSLRFLITGMIAANCLASTAVLAETVGKAVSVTTILTGANGELEVSDPVNRD